MKYLSYLFLVCVLLSSCNKKEAFEPRNFSSIEIEGIYSDSLLSIRAIEILNDNSLAFAANNGVFGLFNPRIGTWQTSVQEYDSLNLHFRAVAHTATDFFMLTIENPALLFKTGNNGQMELVYKETGEGVFYDAMTFWNDLEGIAVGDSIDGCLSIVITRDGGQTWTKISCEDLPKAEQGEGAFAASNTNICVVGDKTWIATTHGNIYYSEDKAKSWKAISTPIVHETETQGLYSIDFYDERQGFAIGGDYINPDDNLANKIKTIDGGKTWTLVGKGETPNYRSCVQYFPNREGKELIAVGFKGVDYSNDGGTTWEHLSDAQFYTLRFLNDSTAYAAGSKRISKLVFKE